MIDNQGMVELSPQIISEVYSKVYSINLTTEKLLAASNERNSDSTRL